MRDFREQNYYELLEVHPKASQQELESSYRRARKIFSPDSVATYALFQADELNLLRRRIEEAFRTLSDSIKRSAYDKELMRLDGSWIEVVEGEQDEHAEDRVPGDDKAEASHDYGRQSEDAPEQDGEDSAEQYPEQDADTAKVDDAEKKEDVEELQQSGGPKPEVPAASGDHVDDSEDQSDASSTHESCSRQPGTADDFESDQGDLDESQEQSSDTQDVPEPGSEKVSKGEEGTESADFVATRDSGDQDAAPPDVSAGQMPVVDETTEITGALLKQAREAKGLTLDDYVEKTKISIYYLRNIENEDFTDLPAAVYVKWYLKQLAEILGLDPVLVTKGYMKRMDPKD